LKLQKIEKKTSIKNCKVTAHCSMFLSSKLPFELQIMLGEDQFCNVDDKIYFILRKLFFDEVSKRLKTCLYMNAWVKALNIKGE
jgi:hypothetical protein